ncbi:hypothetical protein K461DRAFT_242520 [Myriangium duriaei CBS 260.36]|uniref:RING-CH-type domain-containing protein n=1 Tax=Myriangium duriaei CBS 260.36 TaxID=1168546 RepID=A0A9P4IY78_9PEZI|nr:hypothetical protein K461DRAFT_242520 [Myriangium duriaei CBS 260.36]
MTSTSFEPGWQWPETLPGRWTTDQQDHKASGDAPGTEDTSGPSTSARPTPPGPESGSQAEPQGQRRRTHYGPRQCRICLEVVQPTFETPSEHLPEMLQGMPSVSYFSEDGGRLIRPCLCKGSQKYVHEGCLAAWRLQDPNSKRNYWQCPTCKYNYRLTRMTWAHWIGSTAAQVTLTFAIFILVVFILGYVADPILNFFLESYTVVQDPWDRRRPIYVEEEVNGWVDHFAKGLASLGLLGCAKILLSMNPLSWLNLRSSRLTGGGRPGATGRHRLRNETWIVVAVGLVTFLWAVWKGVRSWSKKTLTRASERVMDVPLADDDDDDD